MKLHYMLVYEDHNKVITQFPGSRVYTSVDEARKAASNVLASKHSMHLFVLECKPVYKYNLIEVIQDLTKDKADD